MKPNCYLAIRIRPAQGERFEQISINTKGLIDNPELWPQIRKRNLPKIQHTARDGVGGLQIIAYVQVRFLANSNLFAQLMIQHLQRCGVNLDGCRLQTNSDNEFVGSWQAKRGALMRIQRSM